MSPEDHVCDIIDTTGIEATETYLMISTIDYRIYGYWFYDSQEREILTLTVEKVLAEVKGIEEGENVAIPYEMAPTEGFDDSDYVTYDDDGEEGSMYYDRERFRKALVKLIQTDDDFLDKIYCAYFENV